MHTLWGGVHQGGQLGIIESFGLKGPLKGHLVQLPCNEQGHLQLHQVLRAWFSLTLGTSMDGVSTTYASITMAITGTLALSIFQGLVRRWAGRKGLLGLHDPDTN